MAVLTESVGRDDLPGGAWNVGGLRLPIAILFLNLLDALFTLGFLRLELAEEVNPLMSFVYRSSPMWFVLVKLGMVQLGVLILYFNRRFRLARYALHAGAIVYVGIVSYHLAFLGRLVLRQ